MKHTRLLNIAALLCALLLQDSSLQAQEEAAPGPGSIPEPMPLVDEGQYDIINFLLLGSDTSNPLNSGRTDVIMIVSVNRTVGTVSFLSVPRDLYVYIPGWQMYRINTAFAHGEQQDGEGGGIPLLKETIRYNLGLEIDYFARVDFVGFRRIIDSIGGIEMSVDCAIQDWRLREPELAPEVEENWEMYTLPVGVHRMDGNLALWYVRSRRTSSDFDRGRRQQDMMRALWRHIRSMGLLAQITDIWPQVLDLVETDIPLSEMISLAPLAASIDTSRIASYVMHQNVEVTPWRSPEGSNVLLPVREQIAALSHKLMAPPTRSQLVREHAAVLVVNASGSPGLDRVAADRLAWEGFMPVLAAEPQPYRQYTLIRDHTGQSKGSSLGTLKAVLRVGDDGVIAQPEPSREYDFEVLIGGSYYSCTHGVLPPRPQEVAAQR